MKKTIFLLIAVLLSTFAMAQAPWKEFKEFYQGETDSKGNPHGLGTMGWGNYDRYVLYKGYFKKGIPGDGKNPGELFIWKKGKFYTYQLFVGKGEKHDEYKYIVVPVPGIAAKAFFLDSGHAYAGTNFFEGDPQPKSYIYVNFKTNERFSVTSSGTRRFTATENAQLYELADKELVDKYYPFYAYETLKNKDDIDYFSLKDGGSGYLWSQSNNFTLQNNIKWSGQISNGKICGKGIGVAKVGKDFVFFDADFDNNGIPKGNVTFKTTTSQKTIEMGTPSENMIPFKIDNKYGFISSEGTFVIPAQYSNVVKKFQNGRAVVISDSQGEVFIDKNGDIKGLTDNQKKINEAKALAEAQEKKQRELAWQQEEAKRKKMAAEAEKIRREKFRNAQPGDRVYYSQDWQRSGMFGWFKKEYTMRVVCFVERNVNNGERLQVRVGSVESSDRYEYSTPEIDGIKYSKGDVLWIKPFENNGWQIE